MHDPELPSSFNSGHLCYQPNCRVLQQDNVRTSTTPQHQPIGVQVNAAIAVQMVPFRRQFNLKKANWEQYAYHLDAAVENIHATPEFYDQFVNALRKLARKNIRRGCRRNYVPSLTPGSIEMIEEYREKYEDPFAFSTITLAE